MREYPEMAMFYNDFLADGLKTTLPCHLTARF